MQAMVCYSLLMEFSNLLPISVSLVSRFYKWNAYFTTLATVLSLQHPISYFHRILTNDIKKVIQDTSELTLFLPVDSAWDALDPIERLYLESEFSTDDLTRILNMHAVVQKGVTWSESFDPGVNRKLVTTRSRPINSFVY